MSIDAISGVKLDKPLAEMGVYQQPQHIAHEEAPAVPVTKPLEQALTVDTLEAKEAPKKRKGFTEGVSNIAKFFVSLGEMTKATFKALGAAALAAGGTLVGFWAFQTLPNAYRQNNSLKGYGNPFKNTSKTGKVVTGIVAASVAAYHIIKGILTMNKRTANVDHALKTGHRDV